MPEIAATEVLTPAGVVAPGVVEHDGGRIVAVRPGPRDAPRRLIVPGFVDLQVNGHDDVDVATAEAPAWERMDELLTAQGVTTWCPTLVTSTPDAYGPALERIGAATTRSGPRPAIAGVHLEGPFLGGRPGAHPQALVRPVDLDWLARLPALVRVVTMAPELDGAARAAARLAARGVLVAAGHSSATFEQATDFAGAGARLVTHAFNAMPALHHREPGLLGAALTDDRLAISLIADLVHVHPAVLSVAFRAKDPGRVALVTDAVAWRARSAGPIALRPGPDGAPRLPDGTLAGSSLTMDRAVANVVGHAGVPLAEAVGAASSTPARLLGLHDRGRIEPGTRADLVALGPDLSVAATWIGGVAVHGDP